MKHYGWLAAAGAALLVLTGCSGESSGKTSRAPTAKVYPKIQNHNMTLTIVSTRGEYYISEGAPMMRFQFKNEGMGRIELFEWKTRENENIRIQYAECPAVGDSARLPEGSWKDSPGQKLPTDCPRYPLELEPENSIIMELPLKFVGTLEKPGRYAVRGVLDLTSLDVRSTPVELIIR